MKIETLVQALGEGKVEVKFTKANGEIRVLHGTRNLDIIPTENHPKGTSTNTVSESVVTVYDLDAAGWRSFRKDAVISYTVDFS